MTHKEGPDILDAIIADVFTHNTTAPDYTLSTSGDTPRGWQQGTTEITDTGTLRTAGRNIKAPTNERVYNFVNQTAQPLTLKTAFGTGIAVAAGMTAILRCDGAKVVRVTPDT